MNLMFSDYPTHLEIAAGVPQRIDIPEEVIGLHTAGIAAFLLECTIIVPQVEEREN
jgi:hypothetical protein